MLQAKCVRVCVPWLRTDMAQQPMPFEIRFVAAARPSTLPTSISMFGHYRKRYRRSHKGSARFVHRGIFRVHGTDLGHTVLPSQPSRSANDYQKRGENDSYRGLCLTSYLSGGHPALARYAGTLSDISGLRRRDAHNGSHGDREASFHAHGEK